jgi:hypothetical protein
VNVPTEPSAYARWKRSVIFVVEKSLSLQQEAQIYLDAIADYDTLSPEDESGTDLEEHKVLRRIAMLSLRDTGELAKVTPTVSLSGAQFTEVTVNAPPFSMEFRIACDQAAISRDKSDASEKLGVETAMSKALVGSGIKIDLPITSAVGEEGALAKLAALFYALQMMTGLERITEMKLVRLINWAFAGNASSTWNSTGMENNKPVPLEKRLLAFIGRYAVGNGAISGLKNLLRGLNHLPGESLLTFVNRVNIYVSGTDTEMQRIALEDIYLRIDGQWQSDNQVLFEKFKEKLVECSKDVMNPWQFLHEWVVKNGFSEKVDRASTEPLIQPGGFSANPTKEREILSQNSAATTHGGGKGAFRPVAGVAGMGGARSGARASGSTGNPGISIQKNSNGPRTGPNGAKFTGNCFYCQKTGHRSVDCRKKAADEAKGIKRDVAATAPSKDIGSAGVDCNGDGVWDVLIAPDVRVRTSKTEVGGITMFVDSLA